MALFRTGGGKTVVRETKTITAYNGSNNFTFDLSSYNTAGKSASDFIVSLEGANSLQACNDLAVNTAGITFANDTLTVPVSMYGGTSVNTVSLKFVIVF